MCPGPRAVIATCEFTSGPRVSPPSHHANAHLKLAFICLKLSKINITVTSIVLTPLDGRIIIRKGQQLKLQFYKAAIFVEIRHTSEQFERGSWILLSPSRGLVASLRGAEAARKNHLWITVTRHDDATARHSDSRELRCLSHGRQ